MNRDNHHGFTLPELLIVMLIAGVLGGGVIQGWQRWQQQQQLRESVLQLQAFLLQLRAPSGWHNRELKLWLQPGQGGCLGTGPVPPAGCTTPSRWWFTPPYAGIHLSALTGEPGFYGRRDVARAGSVEITSAAGRWRAIISARARVRLCQPEAATCG